ncbi:Os10g0460700 [Oryza sativa Japonica Group]|uniref:Os10g0460700 protein n=1 Tax=Oryza sativa subsp. japonica TaxID=39947 RepID=A0A0P0XVF2_ORYSJ|nr:Os10g0460700 [Oryza sativa Japonica Group]
MRRQTTAADEEAVDGSEKAAAPAAQEDGEDVVDSSEKAAAAAAPVAQQDSEEAVDGLEKAAAVQEESRAVVCTRESSRPRVRIILSPVGRHGLSRNTQQYTNNQMHIWAGCGN